MGQPVHSARYADDAVPPGVVAAQIVQMILGQQYGREGRRAQMDVQPPGGSPARLSSSQISPAHR